MEYIQGSLTARFRTYMIAGLAPAPDTPLLEQLHLFDHGLVQSGNLYGVLEASEFLSPPNLISRGPLLIWFFSPSLCLCSLISPRLISITPVSPFSPSLIFSLLLLNLPSLPPCLTVRLLFDENGLNKTFNEPETQLSAACEIQWFKQS